MAVRSYIQLSRNPELCGNSADSKALVHSAGTSRPISVERSLIAHMINSMWSLERNPIEIILHFSLFLRIPTLFVSSILMCITYWANSMFYSRNYTSVTVKGKIEFDTILV